jgi:hypothetical protein
MYAVEYMYAASTKVLPNVLSHRGYESEKKVNFPFWSRICFYFFSKYTSGVMPFSGQASGLKRALRTPSNLVGLPDGMAVV